ncbi:unnamed protein product [Mesocestoides corti]|uniref:Uncharacterized protein n=2 Tax=Mesocestoides corti TaxID=53468 RepID=A0A0R3UAH4_MESCO|nr:unnamed protein product [Mesocestoides corti]
MKEIKKLGRRIEEADRRYEALFNYSPTNERHQGVVDGTKAEASCSATFTAKAVEAPLVFGLKAASRAQRQIGKAMKAGQATRAAFTAANATRRTLKMATKSLIFVDVIFTAWEFASLIKDWKTRDPTEGDIDVLIEQLQHARESEGNANPPRGHPFPYSNSPKALAL